MGLTVSPRRGGLQAGEVCRVEAAGRDLGGGTDLKNAALDAGDVLHMTVAVTAFERHRAQLIEVGRSGQLMCEFRKA